jgi:hypothetical protein
VSLLRALKREFGFYCIELCTEESAEPAQSEMAFVMGGDGNDGVLSSMEQYDASSGQWSFAAEMGTARCCFGACVLMGELYVTGGLGNPGYLESVEKYTPPSDTWSAVVDLPEGRCKHAAVAVGSAMYVLGGKVGDGYITATMLKFNSFQNSWSEVAPMPEGKDGCAACAVGSDIYVFGGWGGRQNSVFKYDTVADSWSTLASMPSIASFDHSLCVLDGLIYIVGAGRDLGGGFACREVLRFDPASDEWSTLAPTLHRKDSSSSFALRGCLYAAGSALDYDLVERCDVSTDTWTIVVDMLEERVSSGAVTIEIGSGPAEEQELFDVLIAEAFSQPQL